MKIIIVILLMFPILANAGEVELSLKNYSDTSNDANFVLKSWEGIELKYKHRDIYYFLSYETANAVMVYPAFDINFLGLGLGFSNKISKNINFYGQAGVYIVDTSLKGKFRCKDYSCGEGLYYGLNNQWDDLHSFGLVDFSEYEVRTENGYGITLGMDVTHPISKNTDFVFGVEYRNLVFSAMVVGMFKLPGDVCDNCQIWESPFKGVQSISMKMGVKYRF